MEDVVILSASRTPIGSFMGALSPLAAVELGGVAVRGALARARVPVAAVEQVIMGNVLQAGLGQAPARQAAIRGGVPEHCGAITVNKVCGSGLRAVMDAANGIRAGEWGLVVAGGMESMSNAPHLLERSRRGFRMGEVKVADSMIKDGLWDPYGDKHMGSCGELCAAEYHFGREEQDAFARRSYERARAAIESGSFEAEVVPVEVPQPKGEPKVVVRDEEPFAAPLEKMAALKPAFAPQGTITAANASKINDGAAALVIAGAERARALDARPLARIIGQGSYAQAPEWFTTAPAGAVRAALARARLGIDRIDRFEINEAFAVVALAASRDLGITAERVNTRGGAVALGHPIGCSGARILTTLLHLLIQERLRYGCASLCLGGGEAVAVVIENLTL